MTKFTTGDRVEVEVHRDEVIIDDSIATGGIWLQKTGVVTETIGSTHVFVKFDDGDFQTIDATPGVDSYPFRNAARI